MFSMQQKLKTIWKAQNNVMHSTYIRQITALGVVHQVLGHYEMNRESSAPSTPHLPAVSGRALRRALASSRASRGVASTCLTERHFNKRWMQHIQFSLRT